MLLRLLIATADGILTLLVVVVAPHLRSPLEQFVQVNAVAVHQECRVHHVVVVVSPLVYQSTTSQRLFHILPGILHADRMSASRILPSRFPPFLVGREVGSKNLLVGNHERLCLPVHIHLRVVCQPAEPRVVRTLRIILMSHQFSIVAVPFQECCGKGDSLTPGPSQNSLTPGPSPMGEGSG